MVDTELAGTFIPAGSAIHLRLAAANRDSRQFPNPEAMDFERENISRHVAFGLGVHTCVGSALARRELELGFRSLLRRLGNLRLASESEAVDYIPSFTIRGLNHLHVAFDAMEA
jgi:cytochrome P450